MNITKGVQYSLNLIVRFARSKNLKLLYETKYSTLADFHGKLHNS
jgi:hypothetical protein